MDMATERERIRYGEEMETQMAHVDVRSRSAVSRWMREVQGAT